MHKVREDRDADRIDDYASYSEYKSLQHRNEISCAECGRHLFVDDVTLERLESGAEEGFEDGFLCVDCSDNTEEAFYASR